MKVGIKAKQNHYKLTSFTELIALGKNGKLMTVLTFYNAKEVN